MGQRLQRGIALFRLLRQGTQTDRFQRLRNGRVALARRNRRSVDLVEQQDQRRSREGIAAGQQFVEDDAKAVLIGRRADGCRIAARLLRRHVGRRAKHDAFLGHAGMGVVESCQAEVEDDWLPLFIQGDVGWLQIAVDDALVVRLLHGQGQLLHQARRFDLVQRMLN